MGCGDWVVGVALKLKGEDSKHMRVSQQIS